MKEITIQIDEQAFKGLNNAVVAYGDIIWSLILGTEVPEKFNSLKSLSDEELRERFNAVKSLYLHIEKEFEQN